MRELPQHEEVEGFALRSREDGILTQGRSSGCGLLGVPHSQEARGREHGALLQTNTEELRGVS
jgi:hypothetical protein